MTESSGVAFSFSLVGLDKDMGESSGFRVKSLHTRALVTS